MALTQGMLQRFKSFVNEEDKILLKVELITNKSIYGYLREVAPDFFVIEEIQKRQNRSPEKIGKKTLSLDQVYSFSEIPIESLPITGGFVI